MLDPADRYNLLDALRPPPGYTLGAGLATTFSLEFDVLLAALLALVGSETESDLPPDRVSAVQALRRLGGRLRVFVDRAHMDGELGKVPPQLVALCDRLIRDVSVLSCSFHPKVWVLRYDPALSPELRTAQPLYRVLCLSRNIADSRCWEIGLRLEGCEEGEGDDVAQGVLAFCRAVLRGEPTPLPLRELMEGMERVRFTAGPAGHAQAQFLWQGDGRRGSSLVTSLPPSGGRALLVAPFLGPGLIAALQKRCDKLWLVSTQPALDALDEKCLGSETTGRVFVVSGIGDGESAVVQLHAKLLLWEGPEQSWTYVGSANGTTKAWGLAPVRNWEAMVALAPGIGFNRFIRTFIQRKDGVLHPWIEPYRRAPAEDDSADRTLERLRRGVAQLEVEADYAADDRRLSLKINSPLPDSVNPASQARVELAPLLLQGRAGAFQKASDLLGRGHNYEDVQVSELSEFVLVRFATADNDPPHLLVLRVRLVLPDGLRESRDDALCGQLLQGADPFTVLETILRGAGSGPGHPGSGRYGRGKGQGHGSLLTQVTMEALLEACTEDSSRIDEIDALLRAFGTRGEIDRPFQEFWSTLKAAHAAVAREAGDG